MEEFNAIITSFTEATVEAIMKDLHGGKNLIPCVPVSSDTSLRIFQLVGVFQLLGIGFGGSVILFLCERFVRRESTE